MWSPTCKMAHAHVHARDVGKRIKRAPATLEWGTDENAREHSGFRRGCLRAEAPCTMCSLDGLARQQSAYYYRVASGAVLYPHLPVQDPSPSGS